jgi:hypothetical protein
MSAGELRIPRGLSRKSGEHRKIKLETHLGCERSGHVRGQHRHVIEQFIGAEADRNQLLCRKLDVLEAGQGRRHACRLGGPVRQRATVARPIGTARFINAGQIDLCQWVGRFAAVAQRRNDRFLVRAAQQIIRELRRHRKAAGRRFPFRRPGGGADQAAVSRSLLVERNRAQLLAERAEFCGWQYASADLRGLLAALLNAPHGWAIAAATDYRHLCLSANFLKLKRGQICGRVAAIERAACPLKNRMGVDASRSCCGESGRQRRHGHLRNLKQVHQCEIDTTGPIGIVCLTPRERVPACRNRVDEARLDQLENGVREVVDLALRIFDCARELAVNLANLDHPADRRLFGLVRPEENGIVEKRVELPCPARDGVIVAPNLRGRENITHLAVAAGGGLVYERARRRSDNSETGELGRSTAHVYAPTTAGRLSRSS